MRHLSYFFFILLLLSCTSGRSGGSEGFSDEELASARAAELYNALYKGNVEAFLNGRSGAAALHQDYRNELLRNYRQHLAAVESSHQGIV